MEVTRNNFKELFPSVKEAIDESDYVSIDTELTGLFDNDVTNNFETMSERYTKYREHCLSFIVVQFGLSAFKYCPKEKKYTHKDFNFYIFPHSFMKQAPDHVFLCQTSSLHFLASNGFDFNKVIYEGIPYLTPEQEEKAKTYLVAKHENEQNLLSAKDVSRTNGQEVDVPDEHKEFVDNIGKQVDAFIINDEEKMLELETCSPYRRKLIYGTVKHKYQSGIDMSSEKNSNGEIFVKIVKATAEEKMKNLNSKQASDMERLDAAVGFRKVLDVVSQSKKLVIGHNMVLDVMHVLNQFYFPVPESLREFKQMVREIFPKIIDTKFLASSERLRPFFENTHLMDLVKQLQGKAFNAPKIELVDNCGYELTSEKAHEGGFDAFATAFCYTVLTRKLGSMQSKPVEHVDISSKILSPFINRIFIMKHYDQSCINLSGPDPEPDRSNVFYVTFPSQWRTTDLIELFMPYGKIYIDWINDVSALVAIKEQDKVEMAKSLLKRTNNVYSVKLYSEYQNMTRPATDQSSIVSSPALITGTVISKKRNARAGGSAENSISEIVENEAEKADLTGPTTKRQKHFHEDNNESGEVTSTAPIFEEDNQW